MIYSIDFVFYPMSQVQMAQLWQFQCYMIMDLTGISRQRHSLPSGYFAYYTGLSHCIKTA